MSGSSIGQLDARRLVYLTVFLALIFHGGLLPFTLGQTYDAYIHIFFGDHYHRSWFDPWEPRWYTGFTVTAYPPGSHQLIGLLLYLVPHKTAFIFVQTGAVSILAVGMYRFSRLWVNDTAAALASLLCIASTGVAETLHIFGQLPTTLSIGIFLNATPHIYHWIHSGRRSDIFLALIFTAGATAAHHVTPIFATLLFVAPLGLHAWMKSLPAGFRLRQKHNFQTARVLVAAPARGIVLGILMLLVIMLVVFPYWHWSITDPITQVSIPHGSRESFIARPDLGLIFFIIPWGLLILIMPYVIWCVFRSTLWPLALSVLLCLLLGTGGTTPLPKLLLGPAFDILTLDRFTFWGTLLVMPFAGQISASLLNGVARSHLNNSVGRTLSRLILAIGGTLYGVSGIAVATLPLVKPTQPDFIDPTPIVQFMAEDDHSDWRYLTLGFGDQFAYHSALIDGYSVDGNYHSARRLPQLMSYSVERLENSKYLGVPGLGSLQQFLTNADTYNLKFIFSNDDFYDPLLYYSGWTKLLRLRNGVTVWEKPGVTPLPYPVPRRSVPKYQTFMWGLIPPLSLFLVFGTLVTLGVRGRLIELKEDISQERPSRTRPPGYRNTIRLVLAVFTLACFTSPIAIMSFPRAEPGPVEVLNQHYIHLDMREFSKAHALISRESRPDFETYLKILRSRGGLISSYSKLLDVEVEIESKSEDEVLLNSHRTYLTALGTRTVTSSERLVKVEGAWRLDNNSAAKQLSDATMTQSISVKTHDTSVMRWPERGTRTNGPDRPSLSISTPHLINLEDRVRIIGRVMNTSTQPACINVGAVAYFDDKQFEQYMGPLGIHRLLPGEIGHYSIEFEGVLQLQDADFNMGFDPEFFRLPEFETNPEKVDLQVQTLFCSIERAINLKLEDISLTIDGTSLDLSISNHGTTVANVVKISLVYFDNNEQPVLLEPYYLETNLVPGEIKRERIPLHDGKGFSYIKPLSEPMVNNDNITLNQGQVNGAVLLDNDSPFKRVALELDAIPFEPTF